VCGFVWPSYACYYYHYYYQPLLLLLLLPTITTTTTTATTNHYYYYYALHFPSEGVALHNTARPLAIFVAWCVSFVLCSVRAPLDTTPSGGEAWDTRPCSRLCHQIQIRKVFLSHKFDQQNSYFTKPGSVLLCYRLTSTILAADSNHFVYFYFASIAKFNPCAICNINCTS